MAIKFYHTGQQFDIFSNTTKIPVQMNLNGKSFHAHSTEAVFQGLKGLGITGRDKNAQAMIESEPRKLGGLRDWAKENDFNASGDAEIFDQPYAGKYTVKEEVMYQILLAKATQNPQICNALLDTGNENIIEDTSQASYDDSFWGNGLNGQGKNALGEAWMRVRTTLRDELTKDHQIRVRTGLSDDLADKLGHKGHIKNSQISPAYYTEANLGEIRAKSPATTVAAVQLNQFHPIQPSPGLGAHLAQAQQGHNALQQQMSPAPAAAGPAASTTMPKYGTKPATSVAITGPTLADLKAALESKILKPGEELKLEEGQKIIEKIIIREKTPGVYEIEKRSIESVRKENPEHQRELEMATQKVDGLILAVKEIEKKAEEEQRKFTQEKDKYDSDLKTFKSSEEAREKKLTENEDRREKEIQNRNRQKDEKWATETKEYEARVQAANDEAAKAAAAAKSVPAPQTGDQTVAADMGKSGRSAIEFVTAVKSLEKFIEDIKVQQKDDPKFKPLSSQGGMSAVASSASSHTLREIIEKYLSKEKYNPLGFKKWQNFSEESRKGMTIKQIDELMKEYYAVRDKNALKPASAAPVQIPAPAPTAPTIPSPPISIVKPTKDKHEEFIREIFKPNDPPKPPLDDELKKTKEALQHKNKELEVAQNALANLKDKSPISEKVEKSNSFGTISYNEQEKRVNINFKSTDPKHVHEVVDSVKTLQGVVTIHNPGTTPDLAVQLTKQALLTFKKAPNYEPQPISPTLLNKICNDVKADIEEYIKKNAKDPNAVAAAQKNFNDLVMTIPETERTVTPYPTAPAAPAATPVPDVPIELTAAKEPARPGSSR